MRARTHTHTYPSSNHRRRAPQSKRPPRKTFRPVTIAYARNPFFFALSLISSNDINAPPRRATTDRYEMSRGDGAARESESSQQLAQRDGECRRKEHTKGSEDRDKEKQNKTALHTHSPASPPQDEHNLDPKIRPCYTPPGRSKHPRKQRRGWIRAQLVAVRRLSPFVPRPPPPPPLRCALSPRRLSSREERSRGGQRVARRYSSGSL